MIEWSFAGDITSIINSTTNTLIPNDAMTAGAIVYSCCDLSRIRLPLIAMLRLHLMITTDTNYYEQVLTIYLGFF